jgi:hypothetical protein
MVVARRQRMQMTMRAFDGDDIDALSPAPPAHGAQAAARGQDQSARHLPLSHSSPHGGGDLNWGQHVEKGGKSCADALPFWEPSSPTVSGEASTSNSLHILPGDSVSQQRVKSTEV